MKKELSERKQKILQAVVDEYITTAEPVSSGEIKEKYLADISSATIRNELASLEEMGYLVQPHVSAGRVPLPQAYKLYVDKVMNGKSLSKNEISFIKDKFSERMDRVEDIIEKTAKVISDVTNYTSVVVVKNFKDVKVSEIKLVPIGDETALVIIITDRGVLRDKTIEIDKADDDIGAYVQSATMLLNRMFAGKTVKEILKPDKIIKEEVEGFRTIFEEVIDVLTKYDKEESGKVYTEGALKMLDYPEIGDTSDAKKFLSVVGSPERLTNLIESGDDMELSVRIGKDEADGMEKCAVVSAKYKINGQEVGHAGVIGPDRMDYKKVISVLKYVGHALSEIMENKKEQKDLKDKNE